MRVLVTGSAGLIGRDAVTALQASGIEVVRFDLADDGRDICNATDLAPAMAGCDGVVHLAAISRVAWGEAAPELCAQVNVAGTAVVIDVARSQPTPPWLVFASSREIYGDPAVLPVTEDAAMAPVNHYGRSKAEAERLVEAARATGLRCAILRFSNVYGTVHDHPDRAVPSLLWRAMTGLELRLSGPDAFFDFVHVDDCVRGLLLAITQLSGGAAGLPTVHLATGVRTSLGDLAGQILSVTQSASRLTILPARSFDVKGFYGHPGRAADVLGWRAEIALDDGLRRLMALFQARGRPLDPVEMPAQQASGGTGHRN